MSTWYVTLCQAHVNGYGLPPLISRMCMLVLVGVLGGAGRDAEARRRGVAHSCEGAGFARAEGVGLPEGAQQLSRVAVARGRAELA